MGGSLLWWLGSVHFTTDALTHCTLSPQEHMGPRISSCMGFMHAPHRQRIHPHQVNAGEEALARQQTQLVKYQRQLHIVRDLPSNTIPSNSLQFGIMHPFVLPTAPWLKTLDVPRMVIIIPFHLM